MWPFHHNNMYFMNQFIQEQMAFANYIHSGPPPCVPIKNERPRHLKSVVIQNIPNVLNEKSLNSKVEKSGEKMFRKPQENDVELLEDETRNEGNVRTGSNAFKQLNLINKPNIMSKPSPVKVSPGPAPSPVPEPVVETLTFHPPNAKRIPTIGPTNKVPKVVPPQTNLPPLMATPIMPFILPQTGMPRQHMAGWPIYSAPVPEYIPYEYNAIPPQMPLIEQQGAEQIIDPNSWDLEAGPSDNDNSELKRKGNVFSRLGPINEQKRAKLTINLLYNKDETIRDVFEGDTNPDEHLPVTKKKDVLLSTDEIVIKFLPLWPWSKSIVDTRNFPKEQDSKHIEDLKSLEIIYVDNYFFKITVTGYPAHFKKEDVLDILIQTVKDKAFVPCFIEFSPEECKFLTIRCQKSFVELLKMGLKINQDNFVMRVTITKMFLRLTHLDFIPRLIVRRRIILATTDDNKADLSSFCLQPDISHFIYFPLNYLGNQVELIHIHSSNFANLVELNLSNNRLNTIIGFNLSQNAPRLHVLNLSNNFIPKFSDLLDCKGLLLRSLTLDGNPLCLDFIHPREYTECAKLLFPTLKILDGVRIHGRCELPVPKKNYCPYPARDIIETFLEIYFPLLEENEGNRLMIADLYDPDALYSVNSKKKLQDHPNARYILRMLMRSGAGPLEGGENIARYISKWPQILHDPNSFTTHVPFHSEHTTILTIDGVFKLPSSSLADEEPLYTFSRTLLLHTHDGRRYHIRNEIVYWDLPTEETILFAFNTMTPKLTSLLLESPDEDIKKELIDIFSRIAKTEPLFSEQCLLKKKWDLTEALNYFMNIVKSSM